MAGKILAVINVISVWLSFVQSSILPSSYDVVYTSPAPPVNGSSSSMPLGGHDHGLNVWAENGTILFYVAKAGCFDENNSLLKLGRVRLTLDPNPFAAGQPFEQRLILEDGYMRFTGGNDSTVTLWVDMLNPFIHVEVSSLSALQLTAALEMWRTEDHNMTTQEMEQSSWTGIPGAPAITYKDSIQFWRNTSILISHRNKNTIVFDATLAQQQLTDYKDQIYDPMANNTFGLWMYGDGLSPAGTSRGVYANTSFTAWNLKSQQPAKTFNITIVTHQQQTSSLDLWQSQIMQVAESVNMSSQAATTDWWHSFWNRSHIFINTNNSATEPSFQVGKNYQIMRYMLGCNAKAEWPSKFNGALFTFDPGFIYDNAVVYNFTPDFRRWGGGTFTAQNQRELYWPLLKSGDLDLMIPQFEFYRRIVNVTTLRGRVYYGINHSWFTEQIDQFGLPQIYNFDSAQYYQKLPRNPAFNPGMEWDAWIIWLSDTALEFCMMILDAYYYFGFDPTPYMPFIENEVMWFDSLYTMFQADRDVFPYTGYYGNESLVLYSATACETYKAAYNPASTVSGLRAVITRILQVNPKYAVANQSYYKGLLKRIPPTPLRHQQDRQTIAPAEAWARIFNTEIPQLYPVFPWHEYGLGLPNLTTAINTYLYDTDTQSFHSYEGWKQDAIWLAEMGLTAQAQNMTTLKLQDSGDNRFPTFWGPGFDWSPEMDQGATGMIALQEMLMQTYGNSSKTIRMLPAWPGNWTADFKLRAPFNTTVEGTVQGGKLTKLIVDPETRMKDVIIGSG